MCWSCCIITLSFFDLTWCIQICSHCHLLLALLIQWHVLRAATKATFDIVGISSQSSYHNVLSKWERGSLKRYSCYSIVATIVCSNCTICTIPLDVHFCSQSFLPKYLLTCAAHLSSRIWSPIKRPRVATLTHQLSCLSASPTWGPSSSSWPSPSSPSPPGIFYLSSLLFKVKAGQTS